MPTIRATLIDPTGLPLAGGSLRVSRKYPRLAPDGRSYVPMEISRPTNASGLITVDLYEGLHDFAVYPANSDIPSYFFEAYVPAINGNVELLELYRPYGYLEPETVAKPWDDNLISLSDAYRLASNGQVPAKSSNGYTFITPSAEGPPQATWGQITGTLGSQTDLAAALAGKADAAHGHNVATSGAPGFLSASDKTKLDGITAGATANSTDAFLRDRANHTGAQAIATVTGLQAALDGKQNGSIELTGVASLGTLGFLRRTAVGTYTAAAIAVGDLPGIPASQITSGTLAAARIPNLPASQITSGTLALAQIPNLSTFYQTVDADLTAIAGLTTQAYGRSFLELANQVAGRTLLGLGSAATQDASAFQEASSLLADIVSGFATAPEGSRPTKQGSVLVYATPPATPSTILAFGFDAVALTGSTVETQLASFVLPANTLTTPGQHIEILQAYTCNNSANTKLFRIRLGSITGSLLQNTNVTTNSATLPNRRLFYETAALTRTTPLALAVPDIVNTNQPQTSIALDWTQPQTFIISGLLALSSEVITLQSFIVRVFL